jgi:antitoxin component of RelBE/YafQ-DinJ toxin-antitoxin module
MSEIKEKALPLEPLIPNDETIEAMNAARRGQFEWAGPAEKLLEHLNAEIECPDTPDHCPLTTP